MSSYGWTIEDVNELTVPQMIILLDQIKKYPPMSMILIEFFQGLSRKVQANKQNNIDESLAKLGDRVIESKAESIKQRFTTTGNVIKSIIRKRTGERII